MSIRADERRFSDGLRRGKALESSRADVAEGTWKHERPGRRMAGPAFEITLVPTTIHSHFARGRHDKRLAIVAGEHRVRRVIIDELFFLPIEFEPRPQGHLRLAKVDLIGE